MDHYSQYTPRLSLCGSLAKKTKVVDSSEETQTKKLKSFNGGYLGSHIEEERSELR